MTPGEVRDVFERGLSAKLELDRMRERLNALSSPSVSSGIPHAIAGGRSDPTARVANALADLEGRMRESREALEHDVDVNVRLVEGIRLGLGMAFGDIMEDRYVRGLQWKQVAAVENMGLATVHRHKETCFEWVSEVGLHRAMEGLGKAEIA